MTIQLRQRACAGVAALLIGALVSPGTWAQGALEKMNGSYQALTAGVAQIEKSRRITAAFDIDTAMDRYAEDAFAAFNEAIAAVEADAKAEKDTGGKAKLLAFEKQIRSQKVGVERMVTRVAAINVQIRRGGIRIAPDLVKKATPEELHDLEKWLTPLQRQYYKKIDPRISSNHPQDLPHVLASLSDENCNVVRDAGSGYTVAEENMILSRAERLPILDLLDTSSDLVFPPAHAALGAGCYSVCAASLGFGCIVCVVGAGGQALSAYQSMQSGLRNCGSCRWYKPWNCVCRAAVIAAFIAKLA